VTNIYDISKAVGVSIATVSRVLNGSARVSEEVRTKVQRAVRDLDYHPNALARSLVHKSTQTLALVVPDISNPFFPEIARGVEDAANKAGYNVILCNSDNSPQKEVWYCTMVRKRRVDGTIFITTARTTQHIAGLAKAGVPVVLVDREPGGLPIDLVVTENREGGKLTASHLLSLGHKRIGIITGALQTATGADRLCGIREVLLEAGAFRLDYLVEGTYHYDSGYRGMQRLLELSERPTAVIAGNDMTAVGAIKALTDAGLRVPDDVSVVGYDDISLAAMMTPGLTTVAQPKYQMGASSVEVLMQRLVDLGAPPRKVVLQPRLVVRGSTASVE
jgi:LacI family transcriptional regulator